jgi:surface polysaccharide O-acyltransferase-like enzyme
LWYLPYAFVVTSAIAVLAPRQRTEAKAFETAGWLGSIVATILAASGLMRLVGRIVPLAQWTFVFPAVIIGLATARLCGEQRARAISMLLICGSVILACSVASLWGMTELGVPFATGAVLLTGAYASPYKAGEAAIYLSELSFGIYLVHPLCVAAIVRVIGLRDGLELGLFAVATSVAIAVVLRRSPLRRFV